MEETVAKPPEAKRRRRMDSVRVEEQVRGMNANITQALEHQLLQATNTKLSHFCPSRRVGALEPDEQRYFIPQKDAETGAEVERSCIRNGNTGKKEFEVPVRMVGGERRSASWHVFLDQGPVGWGAVTYLQQHCGLRMSINHDRLRKLTNAWKLALTSANLHLVRAELSVVLNARCGPFRQGSFHHQLQQSCADFFLHLRSDNMLYEHLYTDICQDNAGTEASEACGNEAHQASLFKKLESWMTASVKHVEAKASRWFSWEHRASLFLHREGGPHAFLMLLTFHGWRKHWWKSFAESPLALHAGLEDHVNISVAEAKTEGDEEDEEEPAEPPAQAGSSTHPVPRAKARAEVSKMRKQHPQTLKFAA